MVDDLPFPESFPALQAQFRLMAQGRKPAVLVPHWSPHWMAPPGCERVATPMGTLCFPAGTLSMEAIEQAFAENTVGLLLGYGTPSKPPNGTETLTLEQDGREILSVVIDAANRDAVQTALEAMRPPGAAIVQRPALEVVRMRLKWWARYFDSLAQIDQSNQQQQKAG